MVSGFGEARTEDIKGFSRTLGLAAEARSSLKGWGAMVLKKGA